MQQPTSKESVIGFNKEPYVIKVFDYGTHQEVSVSWFNKDGIEESIGILKDDIQDHIAPILASVKKAILNKK